MKLLFAVGDLVTPTAWQALIKADAVAEEAAQQAPTAAPPKPCAPSIPCPPVLKPSGGVTPPLVRLYDFTR